VQVNGVEPRSLIDFNEQLNRPEDRRATVVVGQGESRRTAQVTLVPFDDLISQKLGLSLVQLAPEHTIGYGLRQRPELYISEVERRGPAAQAGLTKGLFLATIGDREARSLLSVASYLSNTLPGDSARLGVVERSVRPGFIRYDQRSVTVEIR
jgi:hypothetical protein